MNCLGLEYFCFEGDGLWTMSDEDLIALAKREAEKVGLIASSDVVDACLVRQPKAYPVYDDAYRDNVAMIRLDLEMNYPTLHLVGRNGMHKCNNQDHAMMTTMLTASNMLAGERLGRELGRRISRGGLVRRIESAAQRAPRFVAAQASGEYLRGR